MVTSGASIVLAVTFGALALALAGYVAGLCSRRGLDERRGLRRVTAAQARTLAFVALGLGNAWAIAAVADQRHEADKRFQSTLLESCHRGNSLRSVIRTILIDSASRARPAESPDAARLRSETIARYVHLARDVRCGEAVPEP